MARVAIWAASMVNSASRFEAGKVRFGDAAGAATLAAVIDLGGEDFGKEHQMGLPLAHGDLGQAGGFGAHGGQVQFTRGGADGGLGCGVAGRSRSGCGRWPVVSGQGADRDHRRDVAGGVAAGVDEHDLGVEHPGRERGVHGGDG